MHLVLADAPSTQSALLNGMVMVTIVVLIIGGVFACLFGRLDFRACQTRRDPDKPVPTTQHYVSLLARARFFMWLGIGGVLGGLMLAFDSGQLRVALCLLIASICFAGYLLVYKEREIRRSPELRAIELSDDNIATQHAQAYLRDREQEM